MNANEGVNREAQRAEAQHVDDDSAGYVYATRMPTGLIKVGTVAMLSALKQARHSVLLKSSRFGK